MPCPVWSQNLSTLFKTSVFHYVVSIFIFAALYSDMCLCICCCIDAHGLYCYACLLKCVNGILCALACVCVCDSVCALPFSVRLEIDWPAAQQSLVICCPGLPSSLEGHVSIVTNTDLERDWQTVKCVCYSFSVCVCVCLCVCVCVWETVCVCMCV